jgi:heme oxygenase
MLCELLKERTSSSHQALEKDLVLRIKKIRTTDDYVELLKMMYGYYHAMENELAEYLITHPDLNFDGRRKSSAILEDLLHLNYNDSVRVCKRLPEISSGATALGAMYVMEGSTLGGQHIARMIQSQLQIDIAGLHFFNGYGADTQKMWESFKLTLKGPFNEEEERDIIETANDTFITFKNWVDQYASDEL